MNWIFQFEISLKKRDKTINYQRIAERDGWFQDLPSPGQPKVRFAKYTGIKLLDNGMGEYMNCDFSYVSTWKELCIEQNISLKQNLGE